MDTAHYVNSVGSQINDSTKYSIDIDDIAVTNIVLLNHLDLLIANLQTILDNLPADVTIEWTYDDIVSKLNAYILCMKKEINFYPEKLITEDCVLTEEDANILMESSKQII